jgi:hypothetical protein
MKRTAFLSVAALLFVAACSEKSNGPVEANDPSFAAGGGSPHFIANATSCTQIGNDLVCNFKETGLSSGSTELVTLSVSADADYGCVNGGGTVPSDPKKSVTSELTTSDEFTAAKNGNIIGSLTISPLAASEALSCPPGQTATLLSVSYIAPATLEDETSGASATISGF